MLQPEREIMPNGSMENQSKIPLQRLRISRKDMTQLSHSTVIQNRDPTTHSIQPSNLPIGLLQVNDSEDIPSFTLNSNNSKNLPRHVHLDVPFDNFDKRLGGSMSISTNRRSTDTSSDRSALIQLSKQPSVPQPFQQSPVSPLGNILSRRSHLSGILTSDNTHYHSEGDLKASHDDITNDSHRRSLFHQNQPPATLKHQLSKTHSIRNRPQDGLLGTSFSSHPLRVIFVRHGERVNQALGLDWFNRAFRGGRYQPFDANLPMVLPRRHSEKSYRFDSPLTVRGLQTARDTGTALMNFNITGSICLSSIAIRCVQTAERILAGMNCRDRVPIRVEPGLFECPHTNQQIVDSFITVKELVDNGYPIKAEYKPIVDAVHVPESLQGYFERSTTVMRSILDRYGRCGETILIITHAPGLRVLTDALKGVRTVEENFYRAVSSYSPLAIYMSEYDGIKWKHSEHPLTIPTHAQHATTKEHGDTKNINQEKHNLK